VNLNLWGTGRLLAAEQDRGLPHVIPRPRIVPIPEGMFKALEEPIQVQAEIVIFFD